MKTLIKYLTSFLVIGSCSLVLLDYFILPLIINSNSEIYIPDVRYSNINKAKRILIDKGLNVEVIYSEYNKIYDPNIVLNISPRAFTKIKIGRTIKLTVSGKKNKIIVDDFTNKSLKSVKILIERIGLVLDTVIYEYNDNFKKNYITSQFPKPGKILKTSDKISYVVSLGTPPNHYIVPELANVNLYKAKEIISKSGLRLGNIKYEYNEDFLNNTIIDQSITSGLRLSFPKSIDLTVTTDKYEK